MTRDDAIYLLGGNGTLERVPLQPYSAETVLQKLIEDYPELLAGEQMDPDDPPRWLLVKREAEIPDGDNGSSRWSADHLLLDHNARPTIVEVKRSSDTRIRREVIGQMLDYAANATVYWPTDRIRILAASTCGGAESLDQNIRNLLALDNGENSVTAVEDYWRRVESNLRDGEVRLLFVADELPRELRRVIEFLNEHMPRIEVLGVEIRQFAGQSMRALVPRVVGQTERARQDKVPAPARNITASEFVQQCPDWCRRFFEDLFDSAASQGFRVVFKTVGFSLRVPLQNGQLVSLFWGFPPGSYGREAPAIDINMDFLEAFEETEVIADALTRLAPFRRAGAILKLLLTPDNLNSAREALNYLWQLGTKITNTASPAD
jgi:hypothetical protein